MFVNNYNLTFLLQLLKHGVGLSTSSDSELITQLLTHTPDCGEPNGANWVGRFVQKTQFISLTLFTQETNQQF